MKAFAHLEKNEVDNPPYPPYAAFLLLLVVYGCLMCSLAMKTAPTGQMYLPLLPLCLA